MFQHILVPLDGSVLSEQAISLAGRLARTTGGSVTLLRVVRPPDAYEYEFSMLRSASVELDSSVHTALAEARHYLQGVATSSDLSGIKTNVLARLGWPAAMIVAVARTRDMELIIMGSRGHAGLQNGMLGSVAQAVTRSAPVPVLVLHRQATPGGLPSCMERPPRVLVPLDGSRLAEAVIEPAAHLAAALAAPGQGAIHLLRVVPLEPGSQEILDANTQERPLREAKAYLASVAERMRQGIAAGLKLSVTWSVTLNSEIAQAIIRGAEEGEDLRGTGAYGGCDLIALATHGRGGLQLLELGSVAGSLLATTRLPVLVVRPERAAVEQGMI